MTSAEAEPKPTCPKCGGPLSEEWCPECARIRTNKLSIALFAVAPLLGLGSCLIGLPGFVSDTNRAFLLVGQWLCFGAPVLGILVVIAYRLKKSTY